MMRCKDGGGWLGIDVAERTTTAQVIYKGKSVFWPLIGLPFAKRSTATSRLSQAPQGNIYEIILYYSGFGFSKRDR